MMTYEEYDEALMFLLTDGDDEGIAELEAEYPEYAARMKEEDDARRGCTWEE